METLAHKFSKRHNDIRRFLNAIDRISLQESDEKRKLLGELKTTLNSHLSAEEAVLYRKIDELEDGELSIMVARSREEHEIFNFLIERMNQNWPNSFTWRALFEIFRDNVEIYLRREESRLLPISDKVFPSNQIGFILERTEKSEKDWLSAQNPPGF